MLADDPVMGAGIAVGGGLREMDLRRGNVGWVGVPIGVQSEGASSNSYPVCCLEGERLSK